MALPLLPPGLVIKILEREGYVYRGGKGTERAYKIRLPGTSRTVIVPTHKKEIPRGTLRSILRQASWTEEDLASLIDRHR
jgi:predicted RNA binding protein YcfA (HicA-like mRNA interferase family)